MRPIRTRGLNGFTGVWRTSGACPTAPERVWHRCRGSCQSRESVKFGQRPGHAPPDPRPAPVTIVALPSSRGMALVRAAEDEGARRHTRARGDQHVLDTVDLVHRRAAHLADALGDPVHAMDVRLTELAAVGVDR